jgi:hypothetical protein
MLLNYISLCLYYHCEELVFTVVVQLDDLSPIFSDFSKAFSLCQIDQSQQILLEATPSETDTRIQELVAYTAVTANTTLDLHHIATSLLAEQTDAVYAGHSLCEKTVCYELAHLRAYCGGCDDSFGWNVVVESKQQLHHIWPFTSKHQPIGIAEILDGGAFRKKFRIAHYYEPIPIVRNALIAHNNFLQHTVS